MVICCCFYQRKCLPAPLNNTKNPRIVGENADSMDKTLCKHSNYLLNSIDLTYYCMYLEIWWNVKYVVYLQNLFMLLHCVKKVV